LTVNGISVPLKQVIVLSVVVSQLFFPSLLYALPYIPLNFYAGGLVLIIITLGALFLLLSVLSWIDINTAINPSPVGEPQMIVPLVLLICCIMLEWFMLSRPYINI
jgi:hypothetical protein